MEFSFWKYDPFFEMCPQMSIRLKCIIKVCMYKPLYCQGNLYIYAGVPRDSVLGHNLFLLYLNDVADNILAICRLFVDYNFLQLATYNILHIFKLNLNHVLHVVEKWSNTALYINLPKPKVVFFLFKANLFFLNNFVHCDKLDVYQYIVMWVFYYHKTLLDLIMLIVHVL